LQEWQDKGFWTRNKRRWDICGCDEAAEIALDTLSEENNTKSKKGNKRKIFAAWINGIMGLLVIAFGAFWLIIFIDRIIMPTIVRGDLEVEVPDLRSLSISEAMRLCEDIGVEIVQGRIRVDNSHPRGTVLDQNPHYGAVVKPGRRIVVILSTREQLILCPDIISMSPREARLIADSSGLQVAESQLRYVHSKLVPAGVVLEQSPSSMTGMMRGDSISITVSLGILPENIVAPNLVGRNFEELEFVLAQNRLQMGRITRYPDKSARTEQILSQQPVPGTKMSAGEKMHFNIAIIPSAKSIPNIE